MQKLNVDLGYRSYPIFMGQGLLNNPDLFNHHLSGHHRVIVSNQSIAPLYLPAIESVLKMHQGTAHVSHVVLPDGEAFKTLDTLNSIYTHLLEQKADRKTTLLALGGGVVGDITGFAAASYQRGINFIQIPTTLLAMVDSSVGGKTGVNHALGKNMIGAFHQPQCVLIDTTTLNTLSDRELSAGLAEVLKYGLIRDHSFLLWLQDNMKRLLARDQEALIYAIKRSCEHKAEVVAADEFEVGQRALLNLGHTFGHAIEAAMGYGTWLHGEAVAAGMLMAARLSCLLGWLDSPSVEFVRTLLQQARLPTEPPETMSVGDFKHYMSVDKKVEKWSVTLDIAASFG